MYCGTGDQLMNCPSCACSYTPKTVLDSTRMTALDTCSFAFPSKNAQVRDSTTAVSWSQTVPAACHSKMILCAPIRPNWARLDECRLSAIFDPGIDKFFGVDVLAITHMFRGRDGGGMRGGWRGIGGRVGGRWCVSVRVSKSGSVSKSVGVGVGEHVRVCVGRAVQRRAVQQKLVQRRAVQRRARAVQQRLEREGRSSAGREQFSTGWSSEGRFSTARSSERLPAKAVPSLFHSPSLPRGGHPSLLTLSLLNPPLLPGGGRGEEGPLPPLPSLPPPGAGKICGWSASC